MVVRAIGQCCFGDNCLASRILAAGTPAVFEVQKRKLSRAMASRVSIKKTIIVIENVCDGVNNVLDNLCYRHLLWRWKHHHVLPLAVSKRDHIPINQLHIPTRSYQLAVEFCAVCALQVDQVGLDFV